jgi:molecular chaperone HscA
LSPHTTIPLSAFRPTLWNSAAAMATDADLLSADERAEIGARLAGLSALAGSNDVAAIRHSIAALAQVTDEFAARRMDRSIRAALAGRRIEELSR